MEMAASALSATRNLPNTGAAVNPKLHALLRGERRNEALMARALVGRLAKGMKSQNDPRLEQLLMQFGEIEDTDQLLSAMSKAALHPSASALLLAAMAQQHRPGKKRSRLDDALGELIGDGTDWELSMLGWLEFGPMNREQMSQLKALYQRTDVVRQGLSNFFQKLIGVAQRRRKLKVLIRTLGAELSGCDDDPAEGMRLATVVRDLKRLLMFVGCEEQCARIARGLGEPVVETDTVLGFLIRLIDQSWLYADWVAAECAELKLADARRYQLARGITGVVKMLPDPCFRDEEQRRQMVEALTEYGEREDEAESDPPSGKSGL
jgi:type III secretion system TyeA family effector delivery regulator